MYRPVYITHIHLMPWLRMHGVLPLLPLYSLMTWKGNICFPTCTYKFHSLWHHTHRPTTWVPNDLHTSVALYSCITDIQIYRYRLILQHLQHLKREAQDTTEDSKPQSESSPPDDFNPLNAELNVIRHLLALVEARHFVHVSKIRVKSQTAGKATYRY